MLDPASKTSPWTDELTEDAVWTVASADDKIRLFIQTYLGPAQDSRATSGVPELVTLGQAALESGWGQHAPRFNFFGIKARASDPPETRQLLRTTEILNSPNHTFPEIISITPLPNGKYKYVVRDWFRAYPTAVAAFNAHGQVLRLPRYRAAFDHVDRPYRFAEEIAKGGYATDPAYFDILSGVMRSIENRLA